MRRHTQTHLLTLCSLSLVVLTLLALSHAKSSGSSLQPSGPPISVTSRTHILPIKTPLVKSIVFRTPQLQAGFAPTTSNATTIVTPQQFAQNDPTEASHQNVWMPDGRIPSKGTDWWRALEIAKQSFIIAEAGEGGTRLHVFTLNGSRVDSIDMGTINGASLGGSKCTGPQDEIGGVSTDLMEVLRTEDPAQRGEMSTMIVANMYASCKKNIRQAITGARHADHRNLGVLKNLVPVSDGVLLKDMVAIWFSNVDIIYEATSPYRKAANDLLRDKIGNIHTALWRYVVIADNLARHNHGHTFGRVIPGNWQGYFSFLAGTQWAKVYNSELTTRDRLQREVDPKRPELEPSALISKENLFVLALDFDSAQFTVRIGPSLLEKELADGSTEAKRELEQGTKVNKTELIPSQATFLELGTELRARARGPIRLRYPRRDNPGELVSESILGGGLSTLLLRTLEHAYDTHVNQSHARVGDTVSVPCLSAFVRVGRRSIADPSQRPGELVCFENRARDGQDFHAGVCVDFTESPKLQDAIINQRYVFNGTSSASECLDVVRAVLQSGRDFHLFPMSYHRQLKRAKQHMGLGTDKTASKNRQRIRHVLVSNWILPSLVNRAFAELAALNGKAEDKSGKTPTSPLETPEHLKIEQKAEASFITSKNAVSPAQLRALVQVFAGKGFGLRKPSQQGPHHFHLPLVGAVLQVYLLEELGFDETWGGKFHFDTVSWVNGARNVIADIVHENDAEYQRFYSQQEYEPSATTLEDVEDRPVYDDVILQQMHDE